MKRYKQNSITGEVLSMRVTESFFILEYTVIAADSPDIMKARAIIADGVTYERVSAYDIGERIAIRSNVELLGKEIEILL